MNKLRPSELGIAVLGALLFVVLAGAEVAAVVFGGHHLLPATGGLLYALVRMPHHLTDPRAAWTLVDARDLPGVVGYWTGQAMTVAVAPATYFGAKHFGGWGADRVPGSRRADRLGADPRARLATRSDVASLIVTQPCSGRLSLGRLGHARGPLLATEDETAMKPSRRRTPKTRSSGRASVAIIGPSRSGKTSGFAIPAILEWDGPVLALSVKDDLYRATHKLRSGAGEVKVFDPRKVLSVERRSSWSPVAKATTLSGAIRAAQKLATASPTGEGPDGRFWSATAEDLIAPLLYTANLCGRGMGDVVDWVIKQDGVEGRSSKEVPDLLGDRAGSGDADAALAQLESSWNLSDRTRDSVYLMARTALKPWADPEVVESSEGADLLSPEWLVSKSNTLYVSAPAHMQAELLPLFTGLAADMIDGAYEAAARHKGSLPRRLLVVIDEAANIAALPDMPRYAATAAGHGIQLVTVWQDLAQIRTRYGTAAATVINNHLAKVILTGISDPDTLELVSRLLGEEEFTQLSRSAQLERPGGSVSETIGSRRLAPMDLIRRMPPGHGCLIYGTLSPAHLVLRPYFRERGFRAEAA